MIQLFITISYNTYDLLLTVRVTNNCTGRYRKLDTKIINIRLATDGKNSLEHKLKTTK